MRSAPDACRGSSSRSTRRRLRARTPTRPASSSPARMRQGHGYVLADLSGRYPPTEWAKAAIAAYRAHDADRIVAEVNNGGEMVEATLRVIDPNAGLHRGARVARQGRPRRAGRRALRAGPGPSSRRFPAARRPDVRVQPQISTGRRRVFARPGRCAGVGADRVAGRADAGRGNFRDLSPAQWQTVRGRPRRRACCINFEGAHQ